MTISEKVSTLLGKSPKSKNATFGGSLHLEQIASHSEDIMDTVQLSKDGRKSSVLDLDFMRSPLDEIDIIQNQDHSIEKVDAVDQALPLQKADDLNVDEDLSAVTSHETNTPEHISSNVVLQPQPQKVATSDGRESALAQTFRSDNKTGFMIFDPEGRTLEISKDFPKLIRLSAAEANDMSSYEDLLNFMGRQADLGDKNVETLKQKENRKMRDQLAQGKAKTYTWTTTTHSGVNLEFSNNYTTNHHLVTTVRDMSHEVEKRRLLRASFKLGASGYWSYSFMTGKSILSEYITDKLSDEEISRVETQGLISIIHPDDVDRVQTEFDAAVTSRTRMDCEFRLVIKQEASVVMRMIGEVEVSPLSNEPEVFIAFLNDLTNDRQREEELFAVKELSRNKSAFLARMSHEIKTPLNAIVGMTEALRDEVDNDEARETASFIADAAENLNNILSQTLEHERLSTSAISLEEDIVDLAEIIKSVVAMWKKPCTDKGLDLNIRISPDLPLGIKLDSSRFRQCLTNLLSNAVKFTDTGNITVAAATMNVDSNTPQLLVAVRDTGIGMSPEALENVFKPFQQGDTTIMRRFGGSGLGMSITQHIIKAMDGHIKIKSAEGEGSTIAITIPLRLTEAVDAVLPASVATAATEPVAPEPLPIVASDQSSPLSLPAETFHKVTPTVQAGHVAEKQEITEDIVRKNVPIIPSDYSGFRVLVVEDNPINQAVVKKLLSKHIAAMEFAFHGEEAMQILELQSFDVILMDIHMPIKDGIETTLEIRNSDKAWADTVIVALTADPDYQQKRVCMNIGMNDTLSKPVKRQDLLDVLQRVLDERREKEALKALSA